MSEAACTARLLAAAITAEPGMRFEDVLETARVRLHPRAPRLQVTTAIINELTGSYGCRAVYEHPPVRPGSELTWWPRPHRLAHMLDTDHLPAGLDRDRILRALLLQPAII